MDSKVRNKKVKDYIDKKIILVKTLDLKNFSDIPHYGKLIKILEDLIFVEQKGFRGVVTTALAGLYLNPQYDPLNNFYGCNPRAIFEKAIYDSLSENDIPCGKSDPLNVAKNITKLDMDWAKGKRPAKSAEAVVNYLEFLRAAEKNDKEKIINFFFYKLVEFSKQRSSINIVLPDSNLVTNQSIATKLSEFVLSYPESGIIPQFVVYLLLEQLYEYSKVSVLGGEESVFGTNTTSKKPADIWLEVDGKPINLFEVTVKIIDKKRLIDSVSALQSLEIMNAPITFICRIPEDINTLKTSNQTFTQNNKTFDFIDIRNFIRVSCAMITPEQLSDVIDKLQVFVKDVKRALKTKEGWDKIFAN